MAVSCLLLWQKQGGACQVKGHSEDKKGRDEMWTDSGTMVAEICDVWLLEAMVFSCTPVDSALLDEITGRSCMFASPA